MRTTTAVIAAALCFAVFAATAGAQDIATDCANSSTLAPATNPLAAHGDQLLPSDGSGFFTDDVKSLAIRAAHTNGPVVDTTSAIEAAVRDFYQDTPVEITDVLQGVDRAVLIDGDVAVPGHPIVFTVEGVPTLYLHWTSAAVDIESLLDLPQFETLTSAPGDMVTACDEVTSFVGEPDSVLAYVEYAPPLAQSSSDPADRWPFGVAAAVLGTSGVVLGRRHQKKNGQGDADDEATDADLSEEPEPSKDRDSSITAKQRVIFIEDADPIPLDVLPTRSPARRQINLQAHAEESSLTKLVKKVSAGGIGRVLAQEEFAHAVNREWSRHQNGGEDGAIASLVLSELDAVRLRLGGFAAAQLFDDVAAAVAEVTRPLDLIGFASGKELAILMPNLGEEEARDALDAITKAITATTFTAVGERVLLTPATGFAMLSDTTSAPELIRAIESARALSMLNLHLDPERWDGQMVPAQIAAEKSSTWATVKEKLRTPVQIGITLVIAWVIPFLVYLGMDAVGFDISFLVYLFVVASLVITGAFILAEGFLAMRQKEPPEVPTKPYPKATALIAAYMPNEAATVIETIESFLAVEYPNDLQIILAYNTPDSLPVEEHLDRIAAEHPSFIPVRIVGSNSKAQNVNAALSMAEGEFIGMFDADHQPRPDAFTRAWRWIDDGYDVVQGHCLTRNGDAGWLAKMIAVEFESIYAVAHPGRAKMHRFGVFGGSNGFWRTELLHETRMRGSMLTEDIDSSMRVVERGFKIRSDRDLVSRELATTTFKQVWNQRMRWAQGWFQVSLEHMKYAFKAKELNLRQKLGIFHLLMWREIYPWLSQQLFPLVAFWAVKAGGFGRLDWTIPIFVATSIFTFSVGPLQTLFAYRLADPEIKQHKSWFVGYLFFTTPFYTEYKNLIARVAHVKQFMGESNWRVTPRTSDPA